MQNTSTAVMQRRVEPPDALVSIEDAKRLGLRWYFTGQPCPRGHVAKRSLSNRDCRQCVNDRRARRRAIDPDQFRQADRDYHAAHTEARRRSSHASRKRYIEQRRDDDRRRYQANPSPKLAQATAWNRDHPGRRNEIVAGRRSWVQTATPTWLTDEQKQQIRALYLDARSRGRGLFHVDHIEPLRGVDACGLHVPWNLQILPKLDNIRKGNRRVSAP